MENAGFIFAAYTVIWAMVFGYLLILFNRQKKIRREIDALKATFDKEEYPPIS
jgi:CcmD family protein